MHEGQPLAGVKGIGPRLAARLADLGLSTLQDVLLHLPLRYEDRTRLFRLGGLAPGMEALAGGTVQHTEVVYRGRRSLISRLHDGSGFINLRFFYFSRQQQAQLARGARLVFFGDVRLSAHGLEMVHPEWRLLRADEVPAPEPMLTPRYRIGDGVHQATLRKLIKQILTRDDLHLAELLPAGTPAGAYGLLDALRYVHAPPPDADIAALLAYRHPAQQRLAFEELVAHQASLRRLRANARTQRAPALHASSLRERLIAAFPFALTRAQQGAIGEIARDLAQAAPMQRLLQGDVGSGKTVVAAAAAATAVEAGHQVALMAPTALLAEQHRANFARWFAPLSVPVEWLAGKTSAAARRALDARLAREPCIVVGTHALFQRGVDFSRLGLVIVDEQHRFGVDQRLALVEKSGAALHPHQLVMSATPIPRTLAQSLYADLDLSVLDELPPGRTPVETVVLPDTRRPDVVARVQAACGEGRQAYWVCPTIEESELISAQAATDTAAALRAALPALRVGLVHGRLKPKDKDAAMAAFAHGEIDLLVATTVIEVGVDVPNASLMIVENAERLGLSQLHQLRGRVGRGAAKSACVLLYRAPLSEMARARLACLRETTDGFEIARRDLDMRGPGEFFGARQTGLPSLRIADFMRDQALLPAATRTADALLAQDAKRVDALVRRWLGDAQAYARV